MKNLSEQAKKNQYEAQKRIHKATLDSITIWIKKGTKQQYKDLAKNRNVSLNSLIVSLLDNEIQKAN